MLGLPLWAALCALLLIAVAMRQKAMAWTAFCLLANWGLNTALARLTGTQFNWLAMGVVDYVTAIAILTPPLSRWQILIVATYALELIAHAAFAFTDGGLRAQIRYWWTMHYVCWGQAMIVAGWEGGRAYQVARDRLRRGRGLFLVSPLPARMGADSLRNGGQE
jgi:hypothetical protein